MFFELRQYVLKPGQRENWVRLMEEEILPFQLSKGMIIVGSFLSEQETKEDGLYIWIRRFENETEREKLYTLFEDLTGARFTTSYTRVGGVARRRGYCGSDQ